MAIDFHLEAEQNDEKQNRMPIFLPQFQGILEVFSICLSTFYNLTNY